MHDDWSSLVGVADFQRGPEVARSGAPLDAGPGQRALLSWTRPVLTLFRLRSASFQLPKPDHATADLIDNEPNSCRNCNRAYDNGQVWLLADLQMSAGDVFQHSGPLPILPVRAGSEAE